MNAWYAKLLAYKKGIKMLLNKTLQIIGLSMLFCTVSIAAFADTGPKPTMEFDVSTNVVNFPSESIALLICNNSDCSDAQPLRRLGPQGFRCQSFSCKAIAYIFPPFAMMTVTLPNNVVLKSNVFSKQTFNAKYLVAISSTDVVVTQK